MVASMRNRARNVSPSGIRPGGNPRTYSASSRERTPSFKGSKESTETMVRRRTISSGSTTAVVLIRLARIGEIPDHAFRNDQQHRARQIAHVDPPAGRQVGHRVAERGGTWNGIGMFFNVLGHCLAPCLFAADVIPPACRPDPRRDHRERRMAVRPGRSIPVMQ